MITVWEFSNSEGTYRMESANPPVDFKARVLYQGEDRQLAAQALIHGIALIETCADCGAPIVGGAHQ